ncbi:MAG: hypothetical protein RLZZ234_44 [Candidatus Parcubacteria bacterium]|jgi:hypothetical protein
MFNKPEYALLVTESCKNIREFLAAKEGVDAEQVPPDRVEREWQTAVNIAQRFPPPVRLKVLHFHNGVSTPSKETIEKAHDAALHYNECMWALYLEQVSLMFRHYGVGYGGGECAKEAANIIASVTSPSEIALGW